MKLLVDTHTLIWWDSNPSRISAAAMAAIRDPLNTVWASVVSIWELMIKVQLGKMTVTLPVADLVLLTTKVIRHERPLAKRVH